MHAFECGCGCAPVDIWSCAGLQTDSTLLKPDKTVSRLCVALEGAPRSVEEGMCTSVGRVEYYKIGVLVMHTHTYDGTVVMELTLDSLAQWL